MYNKNPGTYWNQRTFYLYLRLFLADFLLHIHSNYYDRNKNQKSNKENDDANLFNLNENESEEIDDEKDINIEEDQNQKEEQEINKSDNNGEKN